MLVYFIQVVPCSILDRDTNYPDLRIPFLSSLFSGKRWDIILRLLRDGICAETSFRPTVEGTSTGISAGGDQSALCSHCVYMSIHVRAGAALFPVRVDVTTLSMQPFLLIPRHISVCHHTEAAVCTKLHTYIGVGDTTFVVK
jgi:hypothetical protein